MTNKRLHASTTSINRLVLRGWLILFLSFCLMQLQAQPTLNTTNTTICAGRSVNLSFLIATNATNITWSEKPLATAIAAGSSHSLALLSDGSVVGWGLNSSGERTVPNTVVGAKAIAAGLSHSLALLSDGSVVGWGSNSDGQLNVPNTVVGAKAIEAGSLHSLALLSNGSVICWGSNSDGQLNVPNTVVGAKAIAGGNEHNLAILGNGSIVGWGRNNYGQINISPTIVNATAVSTGANHSLALFNSGTVLGWGSDASNQITIPNTVVNAKAIAAGGHFGLALLNNGSVIGWGSNTSRQTNVPSTVVDAKAIAAGSNHGLALLSNGSVVGWGSNAVGQAAGYNPIFFTNTLVVPSTTKTYYVTVKDANGNTASGSVTVTVNPAPILGDPSVTNVQCFGSSDGQVALSTTGGTGNITYAINPNTGSQSPVGTFTNLPPQTYIFTATDANGCSSTTTATVSQPLNISFSTPSVTNAKCFGSSDGQVVVSATGGTGNINYTISPNTGSQNLVGTFTGLTAQTYTFTATDANGCSATTTATVSQPVNISFSPPSVTNVNCFGNSNGQVSILATNIVGNVTYTISPNTGSQSPLGTFTGLTAQTYTFTATDANGCANTTTATVAQPAVLSFVPPSVSNPSTANGTDGSVWVGAKGGTSPYTFARSGSNITNQTGLFTGLSAGNYSFTVTDNNGCPAVTSTAQVFAPATLTTNNTTFCGNGSVYLNSLITTNGSTVTWSELPQATAIATSDAHNLALLSNGTVIGWGNNSNGQTTVPNTVVGAKVIAAGGSHSLALLSNGSVVGWGANTQNQITIPNTVVGAKGIAAGNFHSLALLSNGTVIGWGLNGTGQTTIPNTVVGATVVEAGLNHSLALLSNGTVIGWGANGSGQTTIPNTLVGTTALDGGNSHSLALLNDGSVVGWGSNGNGLTTIPNTVVSATAIAAGGVHNLALLSNGSVVGWGSNNNGQTTIPNTVLGATAIAAGSFHSLALLNNGKVIGWGNNVLGQAAGYDPLPLSNTAVSPTTTKTYYVVVTNTNGDKTTGSVTITVNPIPTPPATTTNNALRFDGTNDCVQITKCSGSLFAGGDALTIEYWFKGTSNQSAVRMEENNAYIVAGRNGQHVLSNDGGLTGISVGTGYTDGNWHHIAMTWQRNGLFTSYLDGNQVAQRAASNTPLPAFNSGVYLGALNGTSEFMNGTLDEVRVWTVARSQAQIQANMNVCTLLDQTNLLMYYRFDHGAVNGTNTAINTLRNTVNANELTGTLNGFSLSSISSNWTTGRACNVALPVELIDFKGTPQYNGNLLTWTTANEVNNKGFYVERAPQPPKGALTTWEVLGFVNSKGKAAMYEFIDKSPLWGLGAYRLRQIDNDGKETLSKVISIERKGNDKLKVYPNPVSNILTIETNSISDYQIINHLGQQVLTGKTPPSGAVGLDVSALPQGSYVLKVGTGQVKFVKQ